MKNKILELRKTGKTYKEISQLLKCSKSMICYYCGANQKEKLLVRQRKNRTKSHPYVKKIYNFIHGRQKSKTKTIKSNTKRRIWKKIHTFFNNRNIIMNKKAEISVDEVIQKISENPKCALTGDYIDINKPNTYQFDHIVPVSRGGTNTLDNLQIVTKIANMSKATMTNDEYLEICKKVLENKGYTIISPK